MPAWKRSTPISIIETLTDSGIPFITPTILAATLPGATS